MTSQISIMDICSGFLTSCVMWGRSGTCRCARTAAALEQIQVQVLHGGKEGSNARHFSAPTRGTWDICNGLMNTYCIYRLMEE